MKKEKINRMNLLFLSLLVIFSGPLAALEMYGVQINDSETVGDEKLPHHGSGRRLATIFNVKVYVASFYYGSKISNEEDFLTSPQKFVLRLNFLRDVSKEKMISSFESGFEKNKVNLKDYMPSWEIFQRALDNLNKGESLTFIFDGSKLTVKCKNSEVVVAQKEFTLQLLKIWFSNPPNEELKKGLLNR